MNNNKSRTRERWRQQRESFSEVKTSDELLDNFEDAYPEYFNDVTKLQQKITDKILDPDKVESIISNEPMDNLDDFVKLATKALLEDNKDIIGVDNKQLLKPQSGVHKNINTPPFTSNRILLTLQTLISLIRDCLLIFILIKIFFYGFNFT